jgi:hypothetical protein
MKAVDEAIEDRREQHAGGADYLGRCIARQERIEALFKPHRASSA